MESAVMAKSRPRTSRRGTAGTEDVRTARRAGSATGFGAAGANAGTTDAFYRHIVAGMRNGVLAITRDAHLALINDEAYRIFGVSAQPDDVGQPIATVLRDHPDVVRVLAGAFDLHHLPNRVEMRLKPSNKVIGYTLAFVRSDEGDVIGAAMFFKDLTRVEQLEERERLRDRLAAVGEMAAVIAHEVKNPLAGIEVMAGLLRRKIPDAPDAQMVLTDIINEAKMANAIVQEVLDFVRPIRLQVEHTPVTDAVQGAIQLADSKGKRGNVDVSVAISGGLPHINADQHQITQVFTNLLMNAYEAMGGKGRVTISAEMLRIEDGSDGREAVLVEFADNGPGIPPDVAEKVFDPFFTTKAQGSGLGLAIVRKIVDAHDGRIDLRTTPGQGTTIRVTLPVTGGNEE
jgi:signal transduction histidine kinase